MNRAKIVAMIRDILADVTDQPDLSIAEATVADDVQDWDSINHVRLLLALEAELGIRFETDEVAGLPDVAALVDVVQRRAAA